MTVAQTIGLVVKTRVARHFDNRRAVKEHIKELLDVIPKALGISHTHNTLVGNEFVRGVSGGERKRVSISEVIAAQVRSQPSDPCVNDDECCLTQLYLGLNYMLGQSYKRFGCKLRLGIQPGTSYHRG